MTQKEMNGWNCCRAKIIDILDKQPTLEIVRCKDCKYGDYCGENMFICEFHGCQIADFIVQMVKCMIKFIF